MDRRIPPSPWQWIRLQDQPSALYRIWFGVEFGAEFRIVQNFSCRGNGCRRLLRSVRRQLHIFIALLGIEADRRFGEVNLFMRLRRRPADEVRHWCFQIMHKFKRRRTLAIVRFHARHQLISGILFDPQFQVGKVIGNRVRRNDFDRITTGNQIERQLSRTRLRASNDPCQCHKARVALYLFAALMPKTLAAVCAIVPEPGTRPISKGLPGARIADAPTSSLNRDRERCSLLDTCSKLRWWTIARQTY